MIARLSELSGVPATVQTPRYQPHEHGVGILHLGLGAFHRAHQAVATDDALAAEGGDWRILGANLRSRELAQVMREQNGLYTLLVRAEQDQARIIASHVPCAIGGDAARIIEAACNPAIRILSLTVSEKGYAINRKMMDLDIHNPDVANDLANPALPQSVPGVIVAALVKRRASGLAPFTLLSCDNLPENGRLLKASVLGYARRTVPDLVPWIEAEVAFPSTMVDRITPATTDRTLADVEALIGYSDRVAVETEPFSQWVIEDSFPQGRPAWEAGGAQMVVDPQPYEDMKLRMLNGAHSLIAYGGQLLGHEFVRDAVADEAFRQLIERHMRCAAITLPNKQGLDPSAYQAALLQRFANPAIDHATAQIARDCTEKLPQRWFAPAALLVEAGRNALPYAFATATWMAWLERMIVSGETIGDIREDRLKALFRSHQGDAAILCRNLLRLDGIAPSVLPDNEDFVHTTAKLFRRLSTEGLRACLTGEATLPA